LRAAPLQNLEIPRARLEVDLNGGMVAQAFFPKPMKISAFGRIQTNRCKDMVKATPESLALARQIPAEVPGGIPVQLPVGVDEVELSQTREDVPLRCIPPSVPPSRSGNRSILGEALSPRNDFPVRC